MNVELAVRDHVLASSIWLNSNTRDTSHKEAAPHFAERPEGEENEGFAGSDPVNGFCGLAKIRGFAGRVAQAREARNVNRKPGVTLHKKARERRIDGDLKPFRWNPAGNQSRPVELDQQPEASLAWWLGNCPCEA